MSVGEGALRPSALGFKVSRLVQELAFPERAFLFQAICLAACPNPASHKRRPLPGSHGNMRQDQQFQGMEYKLSRVMG